MERFEGCRAQLPPGALGRRRRLHRRQLPGLRPHAPERLRGRRLQPRLQDDRGRPRDRPRAAGRALLAAAPVPLRALRDRRPAPGLATARTPGAETRLPRRRRRRSPRPLGRLAPGRARRRRARAREGPDRRPAPRAAPAGSCATTTARRRSPSWSRCRSRCSRPTPRPTASARSATSRRCPRRQVDDLVAIREQHERVGLRVRARGRRGALPRVPDLDVARLGRAGRGACCTSAAAAGPTRCRPCATWPTRARGAGARDRARASRSTGFELGDGRRRGGARPREGRLECETVVVAPGALGRAALEHARAGPRGRGGGGERPRR